MSNKKLFLLILVYKLILDFTYVLVVGKFWAYQGFIVEWSRYDIVFSYATVFVFAGIFLRFMSRNNPFSFLVSILFFVSALPTLTLITYSNSTREYAYLTLLYWTIFGLSALFLEPKKPGKRLNIPSQVISLILAFCVVYVSGRYTGFRLHFGIWDVYSLRLEAREFDLPGIVAYGVAAANSILPVGALIALDLNYRSWAFFLIFVVVLNFGIAGGKSVLGLLLLAFFGYFFVKKLSIFNLVLLLSITQVVSLIEVSVSQAPILGFFSSYRTLFLPARINWIYYDFFSQHEFDYFRQGFLKFLPWESPYKQDIAFLIGEYDMGEDGGRANNGLFSDAYSNAGMLGVIFMPFLITVYLRVLASALNKVRPGITFSIVIVVAMNLLSLPFSTAIFSGGLGLLLMFSLTIKNHNDSTRVHDS
jgi:hypothetical protein